MWWNCRDEMEQLIIKQLSLGECSHTGLHLIGLSLLEAIVYAHDLANHLISSVDD